MTENLSVELDDLGVDLNVLVDNIRTESAPVGVPAVNITNHDHPITSDLPKPHVVGTKYEKFTSDATVWDTYVSPKNIIGPIFQIKDTSVTTLGRLDINGEVGLGDFCFVSN